MRSGNTKSECKMNDVSAMRNETADRTWNGSVEHDLRTICAQRAGRSLYCDRIHKAFVAYAKAESEAKSTTACKQLHATKSCDRFATKRHTTALTGFRIVAAKRNQKQNLQPHMSLQTTCTFELACSVQNQKR